MIDWSFIRAREGFSLGGYVPAPDKSRSGVTIATGIDIGNMTRSTFLTLPTDLQVLFTPYLGLTGMKAVAVLQRSPLMITQSEADLLDSSRQGLEASELESLYNQFSAVKFGDIPGNAQTCIMSVKWQYGSPQKRTPTFWGFVTRQEWKAAHDELSDQTKWNDGCQPRHDLEAKLLLPLC